MNLDQLLLGYVLTVRDLVSPVGGFVFIKELGRYRDLSTGQFIAESTLVGLMEDYSGNFLEPALVSLTQRMLDGTLSIADWQVRFAQALKDAYLTAAMIGRGGRAMMTWADYGSVGGRLRMEYKFLDQFAQEIKLGLLSENQILARARLYAQSLRTAYWNGVRARNLATGTKTKERRVLHPAEHCVDCVGYASQGWVPIGTLPSPGLGSECLHHCKCTMEFE
jgi:hypothetical protein